MKIEEQRWSRIALRSQSNERHPFHSGAETRQRWCRSQSLKLALMWSAGVQISKPTRYQRRVLSWFTTRGCKRRSKPEKSAFMRRRKWVMQGQACQVVCKRTKTESHSYRLSILASNIPLNQRSAKWRLLRCSSLCKESSRINSQERSLKWLSQSRSRLTFQSQNQNPWKETSSTKHSLQSKNSRLLLLNR